MWTRKVHTDHKGCWIDAGDEIVRCDHTGPAEVTLRRVHTDGGDDTVSFNGRLFVLTYPGLTFQVSERYGTLRGRSHDGYQIREVIEDKLVPVTDEVTIARARACGLRADLATSPDGTTWEAAGRITVESAEETSQTIDINQRSPGQVHWIRPDARTRQRVDDITVGSEEPKLGLNLFRTWSRQSCE